MEVFGRAMLFDTKLQPSDWLTSLWCIRTIQSVKRDPAPILFGTCIPLVEEGAFMIATTESPLMLGMPRAASESASPVQSKRE